MTNVSNGDALWIQAAILACAVLTLLLSWWASKAGSPIIAIFGRWARWIFLSALASGILYMIGWPGYDYPTLFIVAFLLLFLLETAYNWMAISALSKSDLPLFPKFEENDRGDEWPSNPVFIRMKGWLRQSGFQKREALVSTIEENVLMRVSIYDNKEQTIRLHILFLPNPRGHTAACFTFYSQTKDGDAIITDNVFLPFGGFYPEHWQVLRRPWVRSLSRLLELHRARIDAMARPLMPFVTEPLQQLNEDQREVEQLNRDLGFLTKPAEEIEKGRLTTAGKARLWQEVWTLSYLGLPLKYH